MEDVFKVPITQRFKIADWHVALAGKDKVAAPVIALFDSIYDENANTYTEDGFIEITQEKMLQKMLSFYGRNSLQNGINVLRKRKLLFLKSINGKNRYKLNTPAIQKFLDDAWPSICETMAKSRFQHELKKYPKSKNAKSIKSKDEVKDTFIYLIRNNRNSCIKIGRSKDVLKRERTLQSEEPDLQLIYTSPICFKSDEKKLHRFLSGKRIRGEWFVLNEEDIELIKNYFNNPLKF